MLYFVEGDGGSRVSRVSRVWRGAVRTWLAPLQQVHLASIVRIVHKRAQRDSALFGMLDG
jgi:hypothetical protein